MPADAPVGIAARVEALGRAVDLARPWLPATLVDPAAGVVERAAGRLRHGTAHTVVALAGPTGSGKSTLFNALAGRDLSATGVRRPTTGETHAAAWDPAAGPLLDWLEVRHRHLVEPEGGAAAMVGEPGPGGLVLLDLPDHDSTAVAHRLEVDRLVALVDLLIWVVDPQKYADRSLHEHYVRPFADHRSVLRFVLSKVDTLASADVEACVIDLRSRLVADGLAAPEVLAVSVVDGRGLDELRSLIADEVTARRAAVDRLAADVATAAGRLATGAADGRGGGVVDRAEPDLVDALTAAAGVDDVAAAAGRQHRRDAASAVGWPPLRWVGRARRSPLATLPSTARSATALAGTGSALRRFGEAVGDGLAPPWDDVVRTEALRRREPVVERLGRLTAVGVRRPDPPGWWAVVGRIQIVLVALAAVGLVWLVVLAVVESFLRLDADPLAPAVGAVPVPTALLLGGAGLGLLVALVGRFLAGVGARRRQAAVRRSLRREVTAIVHEEVVAPVAVVLDARRALAAAVADAASVPSPRAGRVPGAAGGRGATVRGAR